VTRYAGLDGQGNVRMLMDESGTVTDTFSWDAWGNPLERTGTSPCFTGWKSEHADPDTKLVYLRARWYDPNTGRFISSDTYEGNNENPLSLHKYLFGEGDAVNKNDPTGLRTLDDYNDEFIRIPIFANAFPNITEQMRKNRKPPTGKKIIQSGYVQSAIEKAWIDSKPWPNKEAHEEGGWIFLDPDLWSYFVVRAPRGTDRHINLRPYIYPPNSYLVADFHTHAEWGIDLATGGRFVPEKPSPQDETAQSAVGVPGIIKTFTVNYIVYGPERRKSFSGSRGYPYGN